MAPEIEKAVGFKSDALPVAWNQRDLLLYAVSPDDAEVNGSLAKHGAFLKATFAESRVRELGKAPVSLETRLDGALIQNEQGQPVWPGCFRIRVTMKSSSNGKRRCSVACVSCSGV